jgi:hypothetical protein
MLIINIKFVYDIFILINVYYIIIVYNAYTNLSLIFFSVYIIQKVLVKDKKNGRIQYCKVTACKT